MTVVQLELDAAMARSAGDPLGTLIYTAYTLRAIFTTQKRTQLM